MKKEKELEKYFWQEVAKNKAIPRLLDLLLSENDQVALKAAVEIVDRAYGRPKESVDHTTNGKDMSPAPILGGVSKKN